MYCVMIEWRRFNSFLCVRKGRGRGGRVLSMLALLVGRLTRFAYLVRRPGRSWFAPLTCFFIIPRNGIEDRILAWRDVVVGIVLFSPASQPGIQP